MIKFASAAVLLVVLSARAQAPSPAFSALMQGRVGEAATLLQQALARNPADGKAHLLLCRADYAQNLIEPAVNECQAAVSALPANSDAEMWLGRALGQKAAHASAMSAFGVARRVRDAFEKAVQLDPANFDAASDLGEFYIAAPGIVGGGKDKAARLAASLAAKDPALSHRLQALLAEKNGDLAGAEAQFKLATATRTPEAWIDLAHFFQTHKRPQEAVATVRQAMAADPDHGPAEMDAASVLTDAGVEPALAQQALRDYIHSHHQTDSAPVFKAHLALGRLLAGSGDAAGARAEYTAAATLAPAWAPARKAVAGQ